MGSETGSEIERAVARIRMVVHTKDPLGPLVMLIWAAQAYLVSLLESCFYLAYRGRSGAGKGTALESCIHLVPAGTILSVVSPAFLAAALGEGRTIAIPEADKLLARDPIVAKILRDGYRRGASYGIMVPTGDKENPWATEERPIFGPKVYDFHVGIDSHLLGRTVVLEMERDDSVDRAMDAERKARHLAPVKAWLAACASDAVKVWTPEKVSSLWDDPDFRKEVRGMGGAGGRDHIVAATMLLVCRVMGWEYTSEVKRVVHGRKTVDEWGEEQEVADAILALSGDKPSPETEIATEALLQHLNERRAKTKLHSLTSRALGGLLVDLGFREGATYVKVKSGPNRDKRVILPHEFIGSLSQASHPSQKTLLDPHRRGEEAETVAPGPDGTDGPASEEVPGPSGPEREEDGPSGPDARWPSLRRKR